MPPRFRAVKQQLREALASSDQQVLFGLLDALPARELVSPLLACLPLGGETTERAAVALGHVVSTLESEAPEEARNVLRRLMWHMNEESGNIGWGIPEAFGEIVAQNRKLADAFGVILISYITNTGHDDNFCDQDVLRRSCYKAVLRFLRAWPDFALKARPALQAGLLDEDAACRDLAREGLALTGLF